MVWRVRHRASVAAAAARAALDAAPCVEPRAALLGEPPTLLDRRLDLGHEQIILRPLDGDLLADELLDRLEIERARLVDEADGAPGRARARRASDAVHVV